MAGSGSGPRASAVKIILCDHVHAAWRALSTTHPVNDDAVHEARKQLKRARASLRLLRETIGERRFTAENARLRDAARPFSRIRDARILLDTAADLRTKRKGAGDRKVLDELLHVLRGERVALRSDLSPGTRVLATSLAALRTSERHAARWTLDRAKRALPSDVEHLYRKSSKAMKHARADDSDAVLHEARKQAKYLAFALEALRQAGAPGTQKALEHAAAIGDCLGADHDLALMQAKLAALSPALPASDKLPAWIAHRRTALQHKAFRLSALLHRRKAGKFARRVVRPVSHNG